MELLQWCSDYHFDYYFRAIVVCFFSLFLFRIGNSRLFSQLAAYDLLIFVILGALLGTAIISKDLFFSSLGCCLIITYLHRFFGYLSAKNILSNNILKGRRVILYINNKWVEDSLRKCSLNKADIFQELRNSLGTNTLQNIEKILMERNGKISFLQKNNA